MSAKTEGRAGVAVRLNKAMLNRLKRAAASRDSDLSKLIRHAIRFWFEHGAPADLPVKE